MGGRWFESIPCDHFMLTNIYHVSSDNGQSYEDYQDFTWTIAAQNEEAAINVVKAGNIECHGMINFHARLVFKNVEVSSEQINKQIG